MNYYLYIIKSTRDNNYYIGITKDVEKRLSHHNSGKVKSTKSRKPFLLIYQEKYSSKLIARKREKYLKSYSGVSEKRKIINKYDTGE